VRKLYALHTISVRFLITIAVIAVLVLALTVLFDRVLVAFEPHLDRHARDQAVFLRSFPDRYVRLAIFGSAALSLFLELAIIRWQGTVFEFFAFYKNFSLLCCFAGLGLGTRWQTASGFLSLSLFRCSLGSSC
jgi:hypothetical protein